MPWLAADTASGSGMRQTRTARANAVAAPATAAFHGRDARRREQQAEDDERQRRHERRERRAAGHRVVARGGRPPGMAGILSAV